MPINYGTEYPDSITQLSNSVDGLSARIKVLASRVASLEKQVNQNPELITSQEILRDITWAYRTANNEAVSLDDAPSSGAKFWREYAETFCNVG